MAREPTEPFNKVDVIFKSGLILQYEGGVKSPLPPWGSRGLPCDMCWMTVPAIPELELG